jgi:hypothetical protein
VMAYNSDNLAPITGKLLVVLNALRPLHTGTVSLILSCWAEIAMAYCLAIPVEVV